MTTLWARLKIWKAFENGEITEECAQYFDELLNNNKYVNVKHHIITLGMGQSITTQSEYAHFNGTGNICVLGSIGSSELNHPRQGAFRRAAIFQPHFHRFQKARATFPTM